MAEWTNLLPIGFVLFGGTLFAFTRKRAGRTLARRDYPKLACRLGLKFEAPEDSKDVGRIVGEKDGFRVRIESDERARIVCYLDRDPGVDLRTYDRFKRRPDGFETFSFGDRAVDQWMRGRLVRTAMSEELDRPALREAVSALRPHRDRLKEFTLDAEHIECVFDFGSPAYLPSGVVESVLPAVIRLAGRLLPGTGVADSELEGRL